MDWRKYDLVEYRKGRYRMERQTWSFWDWALFCFAIAVIWRYWWVFLAIGAVLMLGLLLFVVAGIVMALVSTRR